MFILLAIHVVLRALYVAALVAVCAGVASRRRSRPAMASLARWAGGISFAYAFAWVLFFAGQWHAGVASEGIRMAYPLAVLGLLAWWLGIVPGQRAKRVAFGVVSIGCTLIAAAVIRYEDDYRQRRDALIAATERGDLDQVRHLLSTGLSPDGAGAEHALLRIAPNVETMRVLFDAGAKVEAAPGALELSVQRGDYHQVKLLLEHGADPNSTAGSGTAAHYAWSRKDAKMLELLGRAGAKDAAKYQRLTGALLKAVEARHEGAVKELLSGEYALDEAEDGLRVAAERGYTTIALLLARKTPAYGEIGEAMLFAARSNHPDTFEALIDELDRRRAGFVGRERKAQALALARARRLHDIERIAIAKGAESGATNPFELSEEPTGPWTPLDADILLVYERSGCPAATHDILRVHENGSLELVNRTGSRRAKDVTPAGLAPLRDLFGRNDLGPLQLQYRSEFEPQSEAAGSNVCVSRVTARTRRGATRTVTTTDAAAAPRFLKDLIKELESLREQFK